MKSKALALTFALLVITIIVTADFGLGPVVLPWFYAVPGLDKWGHFGLMGTLAFLVNASWRRNGWGGTVLVAALVTAEEFSQLWFPCRNFDWWDLACDFAGIGLAAVLARRLLKTKADWV